MRLNGWLSRVPTGAEKQRVSTHTWQKARCIRHIVSVVGEGLNQQLFLVSHALKLEQATQS
jgi:hypothetical protein